MADEGPSAPETYTVSASPMACVAKAVIPVGERGTKAHATRSGPTRQPPLAEVRAPSWP